MKKVGLSAYQQQEKAGVEASDPVQLVSVLFTKLMDNLVKAIHFIERQDTLNKSDRLSLSLEILMVLEASLDHHQGGEIAGNLQSLYRYCMKRLTDANRENNTDAIREVIRLMKEIQDAWRSIAMQPVGGSGINKKISMNHS